MTYKQWLKANHDTLIQLQDEFEKETGSEMTFEAFTRQMFSVARHDNNISRAINKYYALTHTYEDDYDKNDVKIVAEMAHVPTRAVWEYLNA